MSSSNFISGNIYTFKSNIKGYFGLKVENTKLVNENIRLRKIIETYNSLIKTPSIDSTVLSSKYRYISAQVINNNYAGTKNYLTIDKGEKDSLSIDLGVISSSGVIGIMNNISKNFGTIQSILNTKSQVNAKLKNSEHFGTLIWNTKDPNIVQLIDIPRLANLTIGDTIVTGGMSTIFPKGILIGAISDFSLNKEDNYYQIDVHLFNDMTNIKNVYIIENTNAEEIIQLEKENNDEEQ